MIHVHTPLLYNKEYDSYARMCSIWVLPDTYVVSNKSDVLDLYKIHEESIHYLTKSGLKLKQLLKDDYRIYLQKEEMLLSEYRKSISFFALRTMYWGFIKRGKIHWSPIAEQHRKGILSGL